MTPAAVGCGTETCLLRSTAQPIRPRSRVAVSAANQLSIAIAVPCTWTCAEALVWRTGQPDANTIPPRSDLCTFETEAYKRPSVARRCHKGNVGGSPAAVHGHIAARLWRVTRAERDRLLTISVRPNSVLQTLHSAMECPFDWESLTKTSYATTSQGDSDTCCVWFNRLLTGFRNRSVTVTPQESGARRSHPR